MSSEMELPVPAPAARHEAALDEEKAAERALLMAVVKGTLIATPICVVVWMLIILLAVGGKSNLDWWQWLGIGALVGVVAGAFFGGWAGFIAKAHVLDDIDQRSSHLAEEHSAD